MKDVRDDLGFYTERDLREAREDARIEGRRDAKWSSWKWGDFLLTVFGCVLVISIATFIGFLVWSNDRYPDPPSGYEFLQVDGQECVRVANPTTSVDEPFEVEALVFCERRTR